MDTTKLEQKIIRQWAQTHNTSESVAKAILKLARNWQDADLVCYAPKRGEYKTVIQLAKEDIEEDNPKALHWGLEHDRRHYNPAEVITPSDVLHSAQEECH